VIVVAFSEFPFGQEESLIETVMESVAIRQRGSHDFAAHYDHLCALNNTCPLPAVKAHLAQGQLDIDADRIRFVYCCILCCTLLQTRHIFIQ